MSFEEEAKKVAKKLYNLYRAGKVSIKDIKKILKSYDNSVKSIIEEELLKVDLEINLTEIELSKMLYNNSNLIAYKVSSILKEAIKFKKTYKDAAMEIFDGYKSGVGVLDAKKVLPKYLQEAINKKKFNKQIEKLKTTNLRLAYKKLAKYLKNESEKTLKDLLYVSYNEKIRYYAERIAKTELHRATMTKRAKEYLKDDEVEFVRFEMSSSHPKIDICDYYANLDIGYGRGIVPKNEMRTLPLHPNCNCIYAPYYGKIKKSKVKGDPYKKVLDNFDNYEKRQILGSYSKLEQFKRGKHPEEIFNEIRPKYPIKKYVDVLDYNFNTKKL